MGQKINPTGFRVGVIRDWDAKWYADKDFADYLHEDIEIRNFINKKLQDASVSRIEIERAAKRVNISVHTAKPGMVIGKGGSEVENLRKQLNKLTGRQVHINIVEIKKPDLDAKLVGENIARQLEQRIAFRRAMRQAMQRTMRAGAKGIKTQASGRLNECNNHIHGGDDGLDRQVYNFRTEQTATTASASFTFVDPAGHNGYPGNLKLQVTYTLTNANALQYRVDPDASDAPSAGV